MSRTSVSIPRISAQRFTSAVRRRARMAPAHLVVAYVAVGHTHELDLVPELDPSRGGSTDRELAVVRMGPENDHPKRFFGGRARFSSAGR